MSATYEPGTVAVATVRGVSGVRVVRGDGHWAVAADTDDYIMDYRGLVTDVRPLVVLDPEDREQVERFCVALDRHSGFENRWHEVRSALIELTRPPKPPEPTGLGAVVEDAEGVRWVRAGDSHGGVLVDNWRRVTTQGDDGWWQAWPRITAVRVLSEGVSDV